MLLPDFTYNDRFLVIPSRNLVQDLATKTDIRLEPRIMHLLCLLVKNRGQVVSRDTFVSEIWDNYGGAEDGLNQGISLLRKVFEDTQKQDIVTIPKKGYLLQASISEVNVPEPAPTQPVLLAPVANSYGPVQKRRTLSLFYKVVICVVLLMILIGYISWQRQKEWDFYLKVQNQKVVPPQ